MKQDTSLQWNIISLHQNSFEHYTFIRQIKSHRFQQTDVATWYNIFIIIISCNSINCNKKKIGATRLTFNILYNLRASGLVTFVIY